METVIGHRSVRVPPLNFPSSCCFCVDAFVMRPETPDFDNACHIPARPTHNETLANYHRCYSIP